MNAAAISSPRLQRVLRLLQDGRWHSTLGIVQEAQVLAVSAVVSELRQNGIRVEHDQHGKVHVYRLAPDGQLSLLAA